MDSEKCSNNRYERYRIWTKYIVLMCLLAVLIVSLIIGDIFWAVNITIASFVIWFLVPSAKNETSGNVSGLISLIHSEMRNSSQPSTDFRSIILRIRQQRKLEDESIVEILNSFSVDEDEVGIEARKMLKSIQEKRKKM